MRSIAIRRIAAALALAALAGCAQPGAAAPEPVAAAAAAPRDPFLGRTFAADAFPAAPADLAARCPALENARQAVRYWVFAEAGDVMVLAGLLVPRDGTVPVVNAHGAAIRLTATGCTLLGPAAEPFAIPEAYADTIPAAQLDALTADAARRYAAALGKPGLAAALRQAPDLAPRLRTAFEAASR